MNRLILLSIVFILLGLSVSYAGERGFRLYASQTSGEYTYGEENAAVIIRWKNDMQCTYIVPSAGTWYFVLTAYNDYGESDPAAELSHVFEGGEEVTFGWRRQKWNGALLKAAGVVK